jgi:hypothetical protein
MTHAWTLKAFDPDQPRVPAGGVGGGRWTAAAGEASSTPESFGAQYPALEGAQREAVSGYCNNDYAEINGTLRGYYKPPDEWHYPQKEMSRPQIDAQVAAMDAAMRPLPSDMVLYRGMSIDWDAGDDAPQPTLFSNVGETGIEDGYTSASLTPNLSQIEMGDFMVELHVPAGTPSVWAAPYSRHRSEQEVILGRGLSLTITDYREGTGGAKSVIVAKVNR